MSGAIKVAYPFLFFLFLEMRKPQSPFSLNSVRKAIALLLLYCAISFDAKSQNIISNTFIKNYCQFKLDTTIKVVVLYNNNFYCLKSNNQVFLFNPEKNEINTFYKDNSKNIGLENLYLVDDTLVGESRYKTFYFDIKDQKWLPHRRWHNDFRGYPIYEDNRYLVSSTCSGEWGGTIYFNDKKTKEVYEAQCTCAVNVIYQKHKYNVTASLSHMSGFTNIFNIENPLKLKLHDNNIEPRGYLKGQKLIYIGDNESKSKKGTDQLVDSIGTETLLSFEYKSKIYYIVGNNKGASLDSIQNRKLVTIENLTDLNIYCDYPLNRRCSGKEIYTFKNDQKTGFISVSDSLLTIYSFDWKHQ